jgi:hypothetical protein
MEIVSLLGNNAYFFGMRFQLYLFISDKTGKEGKLWTTAETT